MIDASAGVRHATIRVDHLPDSYLFGRPGPIGQPFGERVENLVTASVRLSIEQLLADVSQLFADPIKNDATPLTVDQRAHTGMFQNRMNGRQISQRILGRFVHDIAALNSWS